MFNCLPLLLVVIVVPLYAASTVPMSMTYSMEKEPSFQSICGRNVLMPVNGYQHKLISRHGKAGGICFATLMLGGTSKSRCKICVHLEGGRHLVLHKDIMNITFTSGTENDSTENCPYICTCALCFNTSVKKVQNYQV